jgi:hypothetical protein
MYNSIRENVKLPIVIPWEATIETWGKGFFSAAMYLNPPSAETG